ncbi:MAG TPA: MarR family transcriptional regulator [Anaerolineae bacterium]|nr:MarR family transcriptional regulator [Anaerolineae bacterium]
MSDTTDELTRMLQDWIEVFMHRSMHNVLSFAKEQNLSMSQMGALMKLHRHKMCNVSDIGDELGVTSAAASQMLERLVQQELIERTEDPNDRRAKQIALTDKGAQLLHDSFRARYAWLGDLATSFTPDEQALIQTALRLLLDKTRQLAEQVDGRR